jgi:hypothetical protein
MSRNIYVGVTDSRWFHYLAAPDVMSNAESGPIRAENLKACLAMGLNSKSLVTGNGTTEIDTFDELGR